MNLLEGRNLEEVIYDCEGNPHVPGCPAIADDEGDYTFLYDAGECVCKYREERAMTKQYKAVRIIEYIGTEEWIKRTFDKSINSKMEVGKGGCIKETFRSSIIEDKEEESTAP